MSNEQSAVPNEVRKFLSEIGRKGGSSTSERKRAAAVINGKNGGRPKKIQPSEATA